ncbi:hypothetical protein HDU98_008949 [Podochytrium sp. JEL0797]|nr:hypothetical protein HDU98_008949 [Podochytrium sp. JEL0797]
MQPFTPYVKQFNNTRWQDPINRSGVSINIDPVIENPRDDVFDVNRNNIFTSGQVLHPESPPVFPSETNAAKDFVLERNRTNSSSGSKGADSRSRQVSIIEHTPKLKPFPFLSKQLDAQGHRTGHIDEWIPESLADMLPNDATPIQKERALSTYLMQNTSASPLPPLQFRSMMSSKSKYSVYNEQVKPVLHRFLGAPIRNNSKVFGWWSFGIDVAHITLLILIPVQLAWTNYFTSVYWVYFYFIMDAVMMFDCWLQAKLDYTDEYGILVDDTERILWRYLLRNNGTLEFIASWPWEALQFFFNNVGLLQELLGPAQDVDPLM